MKRNIKKVMTGILTVCLTAGNMFSAPLVYAADETMQEVAEEIISDKSDDDTYNEETQDKKIGDEEITDEEITNTGGQGELQEQQELEENSWRYQNGELTMIPQLRARTLSYSNAWKKVNGVYMNDRGNPIEGAVKKGIDVSEHQGKIDWDKVKADGIDFAIIRCGYGNNYASQDDKRWIENVSACERLGIPYGVYIYSYATNIDMAKSEAEHVLRLIGGRSLAYPVYFDMEDNTTVNVSAAMKGQIAKTFCDTVSAAGYKVGVYANLNWWTIYLTSSEFNNSSWSKWVAQYNSTCDYGNTYDIWQCTDKGSVSGISGLVDLNFLMNIEGEPGNPDENNNETGGNNNEPDENNNETGGNNNEPGGNNNEPGGNNNPAPTASGTTLVVRRGNEYHFKYTLSNGGADLIIPYGYVNDEILIGDWDGDGIDTLCVRRGNVYHFKNSLSSGKADKVITYGWPTDEILVGDWNGDGMDTLCVKRGNTYHFKNSLSGGKADKIFNYGYVNDDILVGDWDGDGIDTLCVRRGNVYHFKNSLSSGAADKMITYGWSTDKILAGDWNGDRVDTLCVRRDNAYHIKNSIGGGVADQIILYGYTNDITYAGKWR